MLFWLPKTAALQIPQFCNIAIGSKVKTLLPIAILQNGKFGELQS